jgi:hypothetical protein
MRCVKLRAPKGGARAHPVFQFALGTEQGTIFQNGKFRVVRRGFDNRRLAEIPPRLICRSRLNVAINVPCITAYLIVIAAFLCHIPATHRPFKAVGPDAPREPPLLRPRRGDHH